MLKELMNGNYFIYHISDGGVGIVKAETEEQAKDFVCNAYRKHNSGDYSRDEIYCEKIEDGYFDDSPEVIELGWHLER